MEPEAIAMVGGLVLSQALTLFTTPVVYLHLERPHSGYEPQEAHRKRRSSDTPLLPAPGSHDPAAASRRRRGELNASMKLLIVDDEVKTTDIVSQGLRMQFRVARVCEALYTSAIGTN